jgi:pilus assembly protein CpaE
MQNQNASGRINPAMSTTMHIPDTFFGTEVMSIAVISPDEYRRSAATNVLGECHRGQIREFISYPPDIDDVSRMLGHNFDVVIVDLDSDPEYALHLVEGICAHNLATPMVFSALTDPDMLVRCMRAGAREFLALPLDFTTVSEALFRVSTIRPVIRPAKKTDGQLLVFLGAKGGAGVTTLACNFAVSMAKESGKNTLLIDLNLPLGDAALNLGIRSQYSVVNALQNYSRLDASFFATLLVKHSSGLSVLAAPSEMAPTQVSDEAINRLVAVARQEFDYVVVDAGSRLNIQSTDLFDRSATVYLVTQVGIPELRNSNRMITQLPAEDSPKLEVVVNRFETGSQGIDEEHIKKALTRPAAWKVPNDYSAVRRMQNTATPLVLEDSAISRSIQKMTRSVCGLPEIQEKKKGFSLFK